jgi:hypothetical protein
VSELIFHWWFYLPDPDIPATKRDPAFYSSNSWTALCGELIPTGDVNVMVRPFNITCEACILLKFEEKARDNALRE